MMLSEAIIQGAKLPATIIQQAIQHYPRPRDPQNPISLACAAAGVEMKYSEVLKRWPILKQPIPLPCHCHGLDTPNALLVIMHLFDSHPEMWTSCAFAKLVASLESESPLIQ